MKTLGVLVLALSVTSGCGIAFQNRLAADVEASKAAYKACLAKSDDCERERKAFEADVAVMAVLSAGRPHPPPIIMPPVVIPSR